MLTPYAAGFKLITNGLQVWNTIRSVCLLSVCYATVSYFTLGRSGEMASEPQFIGWLVGGRAKALVSHVATAHRSTAVLLHKLTLSVCYATVSYFTLGRSGGMASEPQFHGDPKVKIRSKGLEIGACKHGWLNLARQRRSL